jgi:hypothetical protein
MKKIIPHFLATLVIMFSSKGYAVEFATGIDEQAQLPYWQINDQGMSLRLVQRLPIQTRGFFFARGFNKEQVERIAQSCVFQTVFKNSSNKTNRPVPLTYNLRDWVVSYNGKQQGLKTREDWGREWQAEKVKISVQLAFEWALYPTEQEYKPGDYNWGMSIFNLKPGSTFDLRVVWQQYGKTHSAVIKNMRCAEDINPQPSEAQ